MAFRDGQAGVSPQGFAGLVFSVSVKAAMIDREPEYRIQRRAEEARSWQGLVNLVRRLFCLPIKKTAQEAHGEALHKH